ncbi:HAMP domain-containing sensor histidine kinase [Anabaena sp. UHCC 0451]|uniref:sensor histidine kinase n=1 Tax=Anabaena sp. UHCC 0451 TaxID=2055235 RepID=UPI002B1F97A4|nr:HAMP domain-containing sensor histidine kinase [Anabaena sp. UHCC 0451]MEA5579421.1 HAMP domain-containing sensor histidine kinase [Anabaena sp. UHCC 0451]
MKKITKIWQKVDIFSLRLRLILGIALVSTLGLGGLASWTSWKMQQILINSHKYNIAKIADRLPRDVQLYNEMMPIETSLQKAINNLTSKDTFLWVKSADHKIIGKSNNWYLLSDETASELMSLTEMLLKPELGKVSQRYFILCSGTLLVDSKVLGKLFVVQDVTSEQIMFIAMVRSLTIASIFVIILICVVIAFYIQHSLQPLRQLNHMTAVISLSDLGQAQLYLENAPTEVKELTNTFNMMLSRLAQSWEQERQFVSNVSHELRTPLTIVNGYLQSVLRRQNNLNPNQIEALETASMETERIIRLLQDLLDLARADSGYLHLRKELCLLNDLVTEVVSMAEQYSGRIIKIESINQAIEVKIDYNRLKQVLLNLIDNAVKYSGADTPVIIKLILQSEEAIIQVCDQGYGIPLQHQSRIFERFYRVDEARTTTGGCGLGLSIVKTFVESMGGKVSVRSRLGEGSIFTISLPASPLPSNM